MNIRLSDHGRFRPGAAGRKRAGGLLTLALLVACAPLRAEDFRTLLDAAWAAREPAQAAQAARTAQGAAAREAAAAWWAEAPSMTLSTRGERPGPFGGGQREWEAELSLPLWPIGQRARARDGASALAEEARAEALQARWTLAGHLREAWWALRLAEADAQQAQQRLDQAQALLDDVQARLRAGDSTPLDQHLAAAERATAAAEATQARAAAEAAARQFAVWARGAPPPRQAEQPAPARGPDAALSTDAGLDEHPEAAALRARIASLRSREALAAGAARAPLELALGISRERDGAALPWQQRTRIAVRVPLGGDAQNRPRAAELQAERAAAEAQLDHWRAQQRAARAAARAELDARREAATVLAERATLLQQARVWVQQAFRAGQFDLPRLLRAQADAAQAEAQAEQARLASARAVSRWNQVHGHLP